jgi:hypothetical protein
MPGAAVERLADFVSNALALGARLLSGYQIFALKLSGRTIASPPLQPNAWAN